MMSLPGFIKWTVATKTHYLMTSVLDGRCLSFSSFMSIYVYLSQFTILLLSALLLHFFFGLGWLADLSQLSRNNILFYYIALIMLRNHSHFSIWCKSFFSLFFTLLSSSIMLLTICNIAKIDTNSCCRRLPIVWLYITFMLMVYACVCLCVCLVFVL